MKLVPFISQIAGVPCIVLPENVGLAIAVEVAGALGVPARVQGSACCFLRGKSLTRRTICVAVLDRVDFLRF